VTALLFSLDIYLPRYIWDTVLAFRIRFSYSVLFLLKHSYLGN